MLIKALFVNKIKCNRKSERKGYSIFKRPVRGFLQFRGDAKVVWDDGGGAVEKWVPFGAILGGRKNWLMTL